MVKRIEIAELIEFALQDSKWKGDQHTRGIWFTDDKGYVLNKIMAIQIKHVERAPNVFYSFGQSIDEQVKLHYPFEQMELTPKKYHLIFKEIQAKHLPSVFEMPEILCKITLNPAELIQFITTSIEGRRERDRAICIFTCDKELNCAIENTIKGKKTTFGNKKINTDSLYCKKTPQLVKLNTATLLAVMSIFMMDCKVDFYISHDRMKINGTSKAGNEVEIVLAQTK